jgi:hypothetical protein
MEGTLEELRRISNCPEGATFSQLGLRKSVATFRRKKPFSGDRSANLGARTRRQVAAGKV